ncbi:hypothetical protein WISP_129311 [Willisornis vidua]|uniref:Uncharacterized protein n=1 Tax=Willisornis vidua TaxID=1566151 RepID=A0ABQ9CQ17_9PASS|nr:hypothetical protein WISP_129311 [Willisornis vidua]
MAAPEPGPGPGAGKEEAKARRDPRVRCRSRHELGAVMELCAPFVRAALQGAPGGAAAEGDVLWKFETALRKNVTINGQRWEEVSDESMPPSDDYVADLKQVAEMVSKQVSGAMKGISICTLKVSEVFLADVFQSHEEDDRKEYESLEQENTSLKREIVKLTDEMKHLSEVLKDHEKICPLLHCTMNFVTIPRPDALASCLPR